MAGKTVLFLHLAGKVGINGDYNVVLRAALTLLNEVPQDRKDWF